MKLVINSRGKLVDQSQMGMVNIMVDGRIVGRCYPVSRLPSNILVNKTQSIPPITFVRDWIVIDESL